ncbi:hypothetical protein [Anaerosporobacter faecicola]|uniref:hypothetical protein n=1 Tax=Anaerosporobacter faecicola TaxID=2718714 RepID=UPI0014395C36|nr:hypothetical protein [Anaerosporobacter faecicola]
MKKIALIGMVLCMILGSTGCTANKDITTSNRSVNSSGKEEDAIEVDNQENEADTVEVDNKENDENDEEKGFRYEEVQDKIKDYMDKLSNGLTNMALGNEEDPLCIRSHIGTIDLASTEGNEVKQYTNQNGEVLRYSISQFGELGSINYEYYKLSEELTYITELQSVYSYPINLGYDIDVLRTTFKEYIVMDNEIYCIDNCEEKLVEYEREDSAVPFRSFEDLNKSFVENEE